MFALLFLGTDEDETVGGGGGAVGVDREPTAGDVEMLTTGLARDLELDADIPRREITDRICAHFHSKL